MYGIGMAFGLGLRFGKASSCGIFQLKRDGLTTIADEKLY